MHNTINRHKKSIKTIGGSARRSVAVILAALIISCIISDPFAIKGASLDLAGTSLQQLGTTTQTRTAKSVSEIVEGSTNKPKLMLSFSAVDRIWASSLLAINTMCSDIRVSKTGIGRNLKKDEYAASQATTASERKHSDVLTYKFNKDMVKEVTAREYEILCKIVQAEAGDQDVYGRILVVNVILNRVNYKKEFANDIEGVVYEKNQFTPITNGAYDRAKPDEITKEAVERALEGEDYSEGALFFFMRSITSKSAAAWFDSLNFILKYGCHEFFKY